MRGTSLIGKVGVADVDEPNHGIDLFYGMFYLVEGIGRFDSQFKDKSVNLIDH